MSAAITAAVIVAGGAAYAAYSSSESQKKANSTNKKLTKENNRANLLMNLISRGAPMEGPNFPDSVQGQSSSILPIYMGKTEKDLATNAQDIFAAIQKYYGTPEDQMKNNEQIAGQFAPAGAASDRLVVDLATGKVTKEMLDESKPVFAARTKLAESKRNAGLEALSETLNEIDAIQAGKGFSGDSTGSRMLKFNARRGIGTQSAADIGAADLANAEDVRNIKSSGRNLQLQNLSLPDSQAAAAIRRRTVPAAGLVDNQSVSLAPFKFFNIGPGAATQFQKPSDVGPVANTGGIAAQGIASLIRDYQKARANNQLTQSVSAPPTSSNPAGLTADEIALAYQSPY